MSTLPVLLNKCLGFNMASYFFITLIVMLIVLAGMAVGVILSNKEIKGSCGGLGRVLGEECAFCDRKEECKEKPELEADCRGDDEATHSGITS